MVWKFLGTLIKRIFFLVLGIVVAFPLAGRIIFNKSTIENLEMISLPFTILAEFVLFLVGIGMMWYAWDLR